MCVHVCMCACVRVCMYVCVCACMCVCMWRVHVACACAWRVLLIPNSSMEFPLFSGVDT